MRIAKGYSVHFETSLCPLPLINIGVLDVVSSFCWPAEQAPGVQQAALHSPLHAMHAKASCNVHMGDAPTVPHLSWIVEL